MLVAYNCAYLIFYQNFIVIKKNLLNILVLKIKRLIFVVLFFTNFIVKKKLRFYQKLSLKNYVFK